MPESEKVILEGGPLGGVRSIVKDLTAFPVPWDGGWGKYHEIGRNEAGLRIFKWKEA